MLFPWYPSAMLAFESCSVVSRRLAKISRGGMASWDEIGLMFAEKADALAEVGTAMMCGSTLDAVVSRYRERVASNEARLSA